MPITVRGGAVNLKGSHS